jgi:hypothetical protein
MALPSSGPLSINDIRVELGASSTNQSLGTFSDTAGFASPDAITDFYGFSASLTGFTGSASQGGNKFICNQSLWIEYWHNNSGTAYPVVGDTIYTNSGGTATIGGGSAGYVKQNSLQYSQFNSSGVVTTLFNCTI